METTTRFVTLANPVQSATGSKGDVQTIAINIPSKADAGLNSKTYLVDPSSPINSFTLASKVLNGSGLKQLYFPDFTGMAEDLGLIGGPNSQQFDYTGQIKPQSVKNALTSYAFICIAFNFDASLQKILNNNLTMFYPKVDEDFDKKSMFTAPTKSNQQFDQELLNVGQAFVWTSQTALRLNVQAPPLGDPDLDVSLTFSFLDVVPYGVLDQWLAAAMIPIQTRTLTTQY